MRSILIFIIIILNVNSSVAQDAFITTYEIQANDTLIIGADPDYDYNYSVDWGDGTQSSGHTENAQHIYDYDDVYTVKITGAYPKVRISIGARLKLLSVEQWGTQKWKSMSSAFLFCENVKIYAEDVPDLSKVKDMSGMFFGAISFNAPIGNWDMENVNNMQSMFEGAVSFNQPIGNWNVSNVTNLRSMFSSAVSFNQDIGNWDVSKVTDMRNMFQSAINFNQPIGNWTVSNVINMNAMFNNAVSYNQDIRNWDVSNVTDMSYTFGSAESFNQDIGDWNVGNVTDMNGMFNSANSFNQDIGDWDVSKVTQMSFMFCKASSFNQDIGNWNVSNVSNMLKMLDDAISFSLANYDALLNGWARIDLQENIYFICDNNYCLGEEARQYIIDTYSWTFNDGGLDPECDLSSISLKNKSVQFELSPNPTNGKLLISAKESLAKIMVYDTNGKEQFLDFIPIAQKTTYELDISHLHAGIYLVKVISDSGEIGVQKVVRY